VARVVQAACRICRREGLKLFLKGDRCETAKCSLTKQPYPPGQRTFRRGKISEYGIRLREKQKLKRFYWVGEAQFRRYFDIAGRTKGNTALTLLQLLERRLDNVVFLLKFARSRRAARQLVVHGHVTVNGRLVDRPSYLVKPGDVIRPVKREVSVAIVRDCLQQCQAKPLPSWLELRPEAPEGVILSAPTRDDISAPVQEQLVIEFCSR